MSARVDLVCRECKHAFEVETRIALVSAQKRCPKCGSRFVRQTFASYLRNGPLSDPRCGGPSRTTYG